MLKNSIPKSLVLNSKLKSFDVLIGNWKATATHPYFPNTIFHGKCSFEWIENGAFILMRSEFDKHDMPTSTAIIGSDDNEKECYMLYFDERGVSRKYETMLGDILWKIWREVPNFSQRFVGTIVDNGNTILGDWELSEDGSTWSKDLEVTYSKIIDN